MAETLRRRVTAMVFPWDGSLTNSSDPFGLVYLFITTVPSRDPALGRSRVSIYLSVCFSLASTLDPVFFSVFKCTTHTYSASRFILLTGIYAR